MVQIIEVTAEERAELERLARSEVEPYRRVAQARALLMLADGGSIRGTARTLGTWPNTVLRGRGNLRLRGRVGSDCLRLRGSVGSGRLMGLAGMPG